MGYEDGGKNAKAQRGKDAKGIQKGDEEMERKRDEIRNVDSIPLALDLSSLRPCIIASLRWKRTKLLARVMKTGKKTQRRKDAKTQSKTRKRSEFPFAPLRLRVFAFGFFFRGSSEG
ncbi:MAG: hypothetical protein ACRD1Z_20985, partial [Vicinamibacteria bacterium]